MSLKLRETEIKLLNSYNLFQILAICRYKRLPHSIHSTSIIYYKRMTYVRPVHLYIAKPLQYAIISLACQNENIKVTIKNLLSEVTVKEKKVFDKYKLEVQYQLMKIQDVPSPYYSMLGILIVLQERSRIDVENSKLKIDEMVLDNDSHFFVFEECDVSVPYRFENACDLWSLCIGNMDKVLICDEYFNVNNREISLAALPFPIHLLNDIFKDADVENIQILRESANRVLCPSRDEIERLRYYMNQ